MRIRFICGGFVKLQSQSFPMEMMRSSNLQLFIISHPSFCFYFCNHPNHQKPSLVPGLRKLLLLPLGWSLRPYGFVKPWTTRCRQKTNHIRRSQRRHYRHREPRHQERGRESGSSASFLKSVRSVIFCSRRKSPS